MSAEVARQGILIREQNRTIATLRDEMARYIGDRRELQNACALLEWADWLASNGGGSPADRRELHEGIAAFLSVTP